MLNWLSFPAAQETVDDAVKAVSQLHGQEFGLRRIRARYSTEELKPQSSRGAERNWESLRGKKRKWDEIRGLGLRKLETKVCTFCKVRNIRNIVAFPCISTKKVFVTVMQPRESPLRVESFRSHSEKDVKLVWSLDVFSSSLAHQCQEGKFGPGVPTSPTSSWTACKKCVASWIEHLESWMGKTNCWE